MIGSLIGPYRVTKKIGQGGMGAVYEAVHETIERRVAIKVLKKELASQPMVSVRFINEARAVNLVNHPGIVQISDYGQISDGSAYIVMELLQGETLGKRLFRSGGRLPVSEILRLVRQITSALAAAHQKNIIHRDLKPDNVMLVLETDDDAGSRERVKILDFGIAKVSSSPQGVNKEQTMADTVLGSPEYMSPEQCKGITAITDKADIYSLGVIMYRMCCGRLPFPTMQPNALLAMHIYEEPAHLRTVVPDLPEPLAELIHRMLAKAAADRPSAQQVFAATEQLAGLLGSSLSSPLLQMRRSDQSAVVASGGLAILSAEVPRVASTLGTASGQTGEKSPPAWRSLGARIGGALIAAGALLAVVAILMPRSSHHGEAGGGASGKHASKGAVSPPPLPQHPTEPTVKEPAGKLRPMWTVESDPPGAQVVRDADGVVLGVTPWHGEQTDGNEPIPVHLRLSGYSERALTLQPGADVLYSPTLSPKGRHSHSRSSSGAATGAGKDQKDQPDPKEASGNELPKATLPKHSQPEIAD
jgi:serine/threonine protein kinase